MRIPFLLMFHFFTIATYSSILSFEKEIPNSFSALKGSLSINDDYYKLHNNSLEWKWESADILTIHTPTGLAAASTISTGGFYIWFFSKKALPNQTLTITFQNSTDITKCSIEFGLNFTGWRLLQARFTDINHDRTILQCLKIHMPSEINGTMLMDYIEFSTNVPWDRSSDMQYTVTQSTDIDDFVGAFQANIPIIEPTAEQLAAVQLIRNRVEEWLLWGNTEYVSTAEYGLRKAAINDRIRKATHTNFPALHLIRRADGSVQGSGLFAQQQSTTSVGESIRTFRTISETTLLPLAYDARINNNATSIERIQTILEWYHEQGWAAGSGLGYLRYEKLRSSGYFHALFLIRNHLDAKTLAREIETIKWYSLFGKSVLPFYFKGDNTDNIRTLLIAKLYYALLLPDTEAVTALVNVTRYMNNAFDLADGYADMIKPDFTGYHHRGAYFGAYYPDGLYASALCYYLLHNTPFVPSEQSLQHLVTALERFSKIAGLYDVPTAVCGRFPNSTTTLTQMLPAFAYMAIATDKKEELLSVLRKRWFPLQEPLHSYISSSSTDICHKKSLGEIGLTLRALELAPIIAEAEKPFAFFFPYAGMLIHRTEKTHVSVKGFNQYNWDFESSGSENIYGRYMSYGQIEITNLKNGTKNNAYSYKNFNWSLIPGTTTKRLSSTTLSFEGGGSKHRNFSDNIFLSGVAIDEYTSCFGIDLHDNRYDKTFRAKKSVFASSDTLLCLGSAIQSISAIPVQTTLFQQSWNNSDKVFINGALFKQSSIVVKNPIIACNQGHSFVVTNGQVRIVKTANNDLIQGYIEHGNGCTNATYGYYILPQNKVSISNPFVAPFEVLRQDKVAHIVMRNSDNTLMAIIFDSSNPLFCQKLIAVNKPVSMAIKTTSIGLNLTIADPDMQRPTAAEIHNLTLSDVYVASKETTVEILLQGSYIENEGRCTVAYENNTSRLSIKLKDGLQQTLFLTDTILSKDENNENKVSYMYHNDSQSLHFYASFKEPFRVQLYLINGKQIYDKMLISGASMDLSSYQNNVLILVLNEKRTKLIL